MTICSHRGPPEDKTVANRNNATRLAQQGPKPGYVNSIWKSPTVFLGRKMTVNHASTLERIEIVNN